MIEVRPVREHERGAVGRLTVAAYDRVGRVSDDYRGSLADVGSRQDADTTVLVAIEDGEVVGSVTVVSACSEHFEHAGHGDGGFRMLAVAPPAQGRGVGQALLDAVLDHARNREWRRLTITTMTWMHGAHRMYERAGFVRRPDRDVRFNSGVGVCYALDVADDAAEHFPPPGPAPDEPPLFEERDGHPPGC